jgi:hypothetical protein
VGDLDDRIGSNVAMLLLSRAQITSARISCETAKDSLESASLKIASSLDAVQRSDKVIRAIGKFCGEPLALDYFQQ